MNIRSFIGASSAILFAWLGATYLHKVPTESYRQQLRGSSPLTGKTLGSASDMVAGNKPGNR